MKIMTHNHGLLHIETPLGIVNIRAGLYDRRSRKVDSIEVIPSNSSGARKVVRRGHANTRLVELGTVKVR